MRLVFDIETNGLYWDASVIHCIVAIDKDTNKVHKFEPSQVEQGLHLLMKASEVIGHNIIGFDLAVAKKLYPWFSIERSRVTDTLILSRLLYTDLSDRDRSKVASTLDPKLIGSHSLKAWGQRLGFHKADYDGGWDQFSAEMLEYNVRDTEVTTRLHEVLINNPAYSERASVLEHQVAHIVAQQERQGFLFDMEKADKLAATLLRRKAEIDASMKDVFPDYEVQEEFIPKVNNKSRGYIKGVPTFKKKLVIFNPGSRKQIAERLTFKYGWEPKEFTPDGSAKIDETVLSKLDWPEAKVLAEYFLVQKRIGMLAEGDNAWIKRVNKLTKRIHGEVITNGAVTGRATHRNPNLAQVPAVGAPYGKECRSLFTVPSNKVLVGVDISGLELRMLAQFMRDDDYAREVVEGDVHTVNMHAAGLPTRDIAKRWIYAFLYGAGNDKLGEVAGKSSNHGKMLKKRFLEKTPALANLIRSVQKAAERGYLIGLDGRRLHIRSSHSALNVLLQGSGGLVCKQWMVEVDLMLTQMKWHDRVKQVVWVHDECQFESDPDIADEAGKKIVECISKAGEFFQIKLPLSGEYKVGNNWAETH